VAHPRIVGLIETCEESGSYDLPAYLDLLAPRMGDVQLVVALDSGAGNYDQLWVTTSLRGLVNGNLEVKILEEGVHSGDAGGVVPSSFRIARQVLDRIDDSRTGVVKPAAFNCDIPADRLAQAQQAAAILGDSVWKRFPWAACCDDHGTASLFAEPVTKDRPNGAEPHLAHCGDRCRRPAAQGAAETRVHDPRSRFACRRERPGAARPSGRSSKPIRRTGLASRSLRFGSTGWNAPPSRPGSRPLSAASPGEFRPPAAWATARSPSRHAGRSSPRRRCS
jgi:hypothetical protein